MESIRQLITEFIQVSNQQTTGQGTTPAAGVFVRENESTFEGLDIKISFGFGGAARTPWMAFTGYGQTIQKGIYPVFLYYKEQKILILAYGVSDTNDPDQNWPNETTLNSITSYFKKTFDQRPKSYGSSYVYYVYDTSQPIDTAIVERDLQNLIREYHAVFKYTPSHDIKETYVPLKKQNASIPYTQQEALNEIFISPEKLNKILDVLQNKKNIILQGPPGTGKTFLAKRLAYLMMGQKNEAHLQMIQFHQSYSYEDFIQGYRPNEQGKFDLKNGIFYTFCQRAQSDPGRPYFFIIDEINRGNLGKIFGELMMLIEHDKRGEEFSMPLTYSKNADHTFYVPANLYLIGTMNTADRSLALVDYALRRRFAFINIEPGFENMYHYLVSKGASTTLAEKIRKRLTDLNEVIAKDLGKGFTVGHSYFCGTAKQYDETWYQSIVENEIQPLLAEYWFDDETRVSTEAEKLLK